MSATVRYRKPAPLADLGMRHAVVEASAGTGKTYLLEHLVVDLLLARGATIDQILVVTFTEKATAELVDRVRAKLAELAALTVDGPGTSGAAEADCWRIDDRARTRLREALYAFDRASISTIHGFCQRLLREHAFLSQRLFDEEAIDEEQAFHAAFTETLRRDVAGDARLRRFLEVWQGSGSSLAYIERDLLKAQRALASLSPPRPEALAPGPADEAAILAAAAAFATAPVPVDLRATLSKTKLHASTAKAAVTRFDKLRVAAAACTSLAEVPVLLAELDTLEDEKRDSSIGWVEFLAAELTARVALAPELAPIAEALASLRACAVDFAGALVARLLPLVSARLEARKREAGLYDFQDMLTLVARGLDGDSENARALLASLRSRYRYALIDEFQDTDEVQWSIFRRIFFDSPDGHVLTVIGDPKQAIYAFRGADVHTYLRARDQIVGAGGAQVFLTENFRSTAPLIDAYNAILDQRAPFFPPRGGILYDHPVGCGRPDLALTRAGEPAPALVVLDLESSLPNVLTWQVKRALLGRMTVEIAQLLADTSLRFGRPGYQTPLRPADIFVLTRTTRESREVGEALRAAHIPFAYFKQEKLFGTIEAREVLDLLRAIADPEDVTARNRAFITPFFGLGLADLAACDDLDAADALMRLLYEWRALGEGGELETLFARIIDDSGVVCRELFFRDGERALTNYLHLFEILQEEAAHTRLTLRELAQILGGYIQGTRRPPGIGRDIQRLESDLDAVQIMTIHHAKGLEAPVAFLYGGFWPGPPNGVRVVHDDDHLRRVRVGRQSSDEKARYEAEQDDEERRVLYVALTRAKARLYLARFPDGFKQLRGCYRFVHDRLRDLLGGFTAPEARARFHRVPVACPGEPLPAPVSPLPAALAAWDPGPALLADDPPDDERRAAAEGRAGFVMTSYSAVKRRHGGFVAAVETAEDPAADERADAAEGEVEVPDELPRGRLSGRFLHELLEQLPLSPLAARPPIESWAGEPSVAALFERLRRRHDRRPEHLPHARRLIHTALTAPVQLGDDTLALASADRTLREMEFLYPIPERAHPLFGAVGEGEFRIERGLVKGYIDLLFEHRGRVYVCDWKGDWLPGWGGDEVRAHCERNYGIQAQLYTLATLRFLGIVDRGGFDARWGGVLYGFVRGMSPDDPSAGLYFRRPDWDEVLAWQEQMLGDDLWRLS